MTLSDYSISVRRDISESIVAELDGHKALGAGFSGDSAEIFSLMKEYVLSGKMLRGILACLGSELFSVGKGPSPEALSLAAALEFFQAGLLVHDDIMDKDEIRRGNPTMHKIFEAMEARAEAGSSAGSSVKPMDFSALGEAIGICVGDMYYFIAWKLISDISHRLESLFSRELVDVCLAQIKDVRLGTHKTFPPLSDVLEVYAYKTARYTICLPLCAGAAIAGRSDAIPALEELGLNLGLLFQLKDDYLGLFGEAEALGKPVGSDIREGKKTPFMILLAQRLSADEKPRFNSIFGNRSIERKDIDYVRNLVVAHGIDEELRILSTTYAQKSEASLAKLRAEVSGLDTGMMAILEEFIGYSLERKF
ncbi:MAG: polyprenyl synthetase family protein [Rectinemataceae bacterium]